MVMIAVVLAVFGGRAISAQDKHTVQVPNGLAFSEFRGYEDWQVISVSHSGDVLAVILGNPEMIKAYLAGIPGNGAKCGFACHTIVKSKDYVFTGYPKR